MAKEKELRTRWVNARFNATEYDEMMKLFKQTTYRDLAEYIRKVTTGKPINVRYRNQSVDDFLADMIVLRKELNAIGNNFNQAVHRLHLLSEQADLQRWLMMNEDDKTRIFRQIEAIMNRVNQLYNLWSQK